LFVEGLGLFEGTTRHRTLFVGANAHDVLIELLLLRRRVHATDPQATAGSSMRSIALSGRNRSEM